MDNPKIAIDFPTANKREDNQDLTIDIFLNLHIPNQCGFEFM